MALVLAVLYFGLVELILLDSQRELAEARRFRARIVAETLAENAAELAALQLVDRDKTPPFSLDTDQGTMSGSMIKKTPTTFEIHGVGTTSGITESTANVTLHGTVIEQDVKIEYFFHP